MFFRQNSFLRFNFIYLCICGFVHMSVWGKEQGIGSPGAGVSGAHKKPDMVPGNWNSTRLATSAIICGTLSLNPNKTDFTEEFANICILVFFKNNLS